VIKTEIKEINEKIQANRKLKQENDNALDGFRRTVANLRYKLKEAEDIKIPEPVDLAILDEEINNLSAEIEAIESNVIQNLSTYKLY
jgi:hypothetical protein